MDVNLTDAELDAMYEASKIDQIPVGSEIRQLIAKIREQRKRLALSERLMRVDTALAKRVGDHIARDSEMLGWLQNWLNCYATDIFPEPDLKKAAEVLKANGMTIDSLSAEMGRHVLTKVIARLNGQQD